MNRTAISEGNRVRWELRAQNGQGLLLNSSALTKRTKQKSTKENKHQLKQQLEQTIRCKEGRTNKKI